MYIFGGFIAGVNSNSMVIFNFQKQAWAEIKCRGNQPCPRNGHSSCIYKGSMYIFGGRTFENKKLNDLWKFDLKEQLWFEVITHNLDSESTLIKEIPLERSGHSCSVFG